MVFEFINQLLSKPDKRKKDRDVPVASSSAFYDDFVVVTPTPTNPYGGLSYQLSSEKLELDNNKALPPYPPNSSKDVQLQNNMDSKNMLDGVPFKLASYVEKDTRDSEDRHIDRLMRNMGYRVNLDSFLYNFTTENSIVNEGNSNNS